MSLPFWFARPPDDDAAGVSGAITQYTSDDAGLIARLRAGDPKTFTVIAERMARPLYAYLMSFVRSPEAAQDLAQDVLVRVWEQRAEIPDTVSIDRFILNAARFHALHALRRRRLEARHASELRATSTTDNVHAPSSDLTLEHTDLYAAAIRAARELPPRAAAVFALRWGQGLSYADIARQLGISVKGVEVQMTRALKAIRTKLEASE